MPSMHALSLQAHPALDETELRRCKGRIAESSSESEWFPRRIDRNQSLQLLVNVKSLIGPDPRTIADDVWAKLVWAGLNLEERDLRLTGSQHHFYPLALVRAMTITWLFAGLRWDVLHLRMNDQSRSANRIQSIRPRPEGHRIPTPAHGGCAA